MPIPKRLPLALSSLLALALAGCAGGSDLEREKARLEGRRLYDTYGCAACHGAEGEGDGPAARMLPVPPRDFRDAKSFRGGRSVTEIEETIRLGLPAPGGGGMPAAPFIPAEERRLLAEYIRSLAPQGDGERVRKD